GLGLVVTLIAFATVVFMLWSLLAWMSKGIFGWDQPEVNAEDRPGREPLRGILYVGSVAALSVDDTRAVTVDWRRGDTPLHSKPLLKWLEQRSGDVVVVPHLQFRLDDPKHNRGKLEALEALVYAQTRPVLVLSEIDPLGYFRRRLQSDWDER